jgi:hypothetical protein
LIRSVLIKLASRFDKNYNCKCQFCITTLIKKYGCVESTKVCTWRIMSAYLYKKKKFYAFFDIVVSICSSALLGVRSISSPPPSHLQNELKGEVGGGGVGW